MFAILMLLAAISAPGVRQVQAREVGKPGKPRNLAERRLVWLPVARKWAAAFGVPLLWLAAIVRAESGWQTGVVNARTERVRHLGNAWGLAQMTAVTARDLIERFAGPGGPLAAFPKTLEHYKAGDSNTLKNGELNLMLAAFYLARNIRLLGKDFDFVSAAHHSGPGLVQEIKRAGKRPPEGLGPDGRKAFANFQGAFRKEGAALVEAVA